MIEELAQTPLGRFPSIAFAEGCSYLLFGLTMPLKYGLGMLLPNFIVGSIHGALFIAYVVLLFLVARANQWSLKKVALAFAASLIPFGTFYADKHLFTK